MIWELYEKYVGIQNIVFIICIYDILKCIVKKSSHRRIIADEILYSDLFCT